LLFVLFFLGGVDGVVESLTGKNPIRNRGARAWENALDGLASGRLAGGISRLQAHAVTDASGLRHYGKRVREFLQCIVGRRILIRQRIDVILALVDYVDELCYVQKRGIAAGRDLVHGFAHIFPDYHADMHEQFRALQAWSRLGVVGEGSPLSLEIIAMIESEWREKGEGEAADTLICWADMWLRWQDIGQLRCEDIVLAEDDEISVQLGKRDRGETTKTGFSQGVVPDYPRVK